MGIRTLCFIGAIVVGSGWLRWSLVVAALILPYVAVVMANSSPARGSTGHRADGAAPAPPTGRSGP